VKLTKADIHAKVHRIPTLKFQAEKKLTSYAGMVIFQALFQKLRLLAALRKCFAPSKGSSIYGQAKMMLLLIVHLIIGFRRLRGLDFYRDDPLIQRIVGLKRLPDVATLSRMLKQVSPKVVGNLQSLNRNLVLSRLHASNLKRVTIDFDGSVQSTKGHTEGSAVGFNKKKKGARSYYPLFATIAQQVQILDRLHRPGNVHDSNGAKQFMFQSFLYAWAAKPDAQFESRMDSAFFSEDILFQLDRSHVAFTCSVPFERLPKLKCLIENRRRWHHCTKDWSFFESDWKPAIWEKGFRLLCLRHRKKTICKGPLQLDLFEPKDHEYEYKAIVTNKSTSAKHVLLFHHGRGSQEKIFGEAKQSVALDYLPSKYLVANQVFTLAGMLAHNLTRELQMCTKPTRRRNSAKRHALWSFETLLHLRQHLVHKAGLLAHPQNKLTLTMNANKKVQKQICFYLEKMCA
jgi:hypothetical protein